MRQSARIVSSDGLLGRRAQPQADRILDAALDLHRPGRARPRRRSTTSPARPAAPGPPSTAASRDKQALLAALVDREVDALARARSSPRPRRADDARRRGRRRRSLTARRAVPRRTRRSRFVRRARARDRRRRSSRSSGGARCCSRRAALVAPAFTRFLAARPRRAARRVGRAPHALVPLQPVRARATSTTPRTCARSSSTSCCPASLEPSNIRIASAGEGASQ